MSNELYDCLGEPIIERNYSSADLDIDKSEINYHARGVLNNGRNLDLEELGLI